MSIHCDCSEDFDETVTFSRDKIVVARKAHECDECGKIICIGDRYVYQCCLFDGDFSDSHTCIICDAIARDYCPRGHSTGMLKQDIYDCLGFDYTKVPEED